MLVSNRDIPLITQNVDMPHLTVENYIKWYDLFVVYPNGEVEVLVWDWNGWYDHCITPKRFVELSLEHNLLFDQATYNRVYEMFGQNHCDSKIIPEEYLPHTIHAVEYTGDYDYVNDQ